MTVLYRKSFEIVGYTADADIYCPECAALTYDRRIDSVLRTVADEREQFQALDFEGNTVSPVFLDQLEGDEHCGRCSTEIS
jgi:hypothetical protein